MKVTDFKIGDRVIYKSRPEAMFESGIVTSVNDTFVFVCYDIGHTSKATYPEHLTLERANQAVCVCAIKNDKVLGVARRGTMDEWGLPGGKVDPGEDPIEALVREVQEETHISLDKTKLEFVFERLDASYHVCTYLYHADIEDIPEQGDAGPAQWITWNDLLSGPFGEYNQKLKNHISKLIELGDE